MAGRDGAERDGAAKDPAGRETAGRETVGWETAGRDGAAGDPAGGGPPGPDLAELRLRLADFASARDWGRYHTPKNLVAALSVEASELLEIFQWLTPEQSSRVMEDAAGAHRVEDEVADVLAYLLQFCEVLGIDPLAALAAKIERNETRFPVPDRTDCRHRHSSE
ncbi:NTP pyrophosphatase, house-cleaning of non-canonical NTPs [Streptomyces sp. OspMP-M45]|nr:NTP pyrophosphatase, house-cleaning of non-canonical NTPs [Streptomyces sp. OspMP-M45]